MHRIRTSRSSFVGLATLAFVAGSLAFAQAQQGSLGNEPTEQMQLPPGWTQEDMMACMQAGMPGEMHEHLAKSTGTWHAKTKMWMAPGTEPMVSEGTSVAKSIFGGRYIEVSMTGEMPGMGVFEGRGVYGYNNLTETFQSSWIDNNSTMILQGTGELSSDGKTMTWRYDYVCPITKKQCVMREVERVTGANAKTLTMYAPDPKSGEEFKMMEIAFTRKPANAAR